MQHKKVISETFFPVTLGLVLKNLNLIQQSKHTNKMALIKTD